MLKDTRKSKAQLIEELDLERQKSARVDLSGAERQLAVERVRVAAMEMRSTEDLARVVAVGSREMYALGVETLFASITFIDETTDWVHHYFTNPHPLLRAASSRTSVARSVLAA